MDTIKILACGSNHLIMVTDNNDFLTRGYVFNHGPSRSGLKGGFDFYSAGDMFDMFDYGGEILDIECRYDTISALVKYDY